MLDVRFIDNFLEEMDLEKYRAYVENSGKIQSIIEDSKLAGDFWEKYGGKLDCEKYKILPYVTITNGTRPVDRHKDSKMGGEKYKILIYLNDIEKGGTIFYGCGKKKERIANKKNRCVIFDMDIEHESEKFVVGGMKKKAIGFRVVVDQE
jgi:hypothetical protein